MDQRLRGTVKQSDTNQEDKNEEMKKTNPNATIYGIKNFEDENKLSSIPEPGCDMGDEFNAVITEPVKFKQTEISEWPESSHKLFQNYCRTKLPSKPSVLNYTSSILENELQEQKQDNKVITNQDIIITEQQKGNLTKKITQPNGKIAQYFKNGQIEVHQIDGLKEITCVNGSKHTKYPNGDEHSIFPDGMVQKTLAGGTKIFEHISGKEVYR